jgi:hypothetical protein
MFLGMGMMVIIQSVLEKQFVAVVFGGYFAAMGLFGFGCASGSCYTPNYQKQTIPEKANDTKNLEFEEITQK